MHPSYSSRSYRQRCSAAFLLVVWFFTIAPGKTAAAPVPEDKPTHYPAWWFERGVIERSNPAQAAPSWPGDYPKADDYAVVNQGQVKNLATKALAEIESKLPGFTTPALTNMVTSWGTPGPTTNDFAPANVGQLKNVAKPFYDRLIEIGIASAYPWGGAGTQANDFAMANIGQAKNLFSFDASSGTDLIFGDSDGDGLPDWWERMVQGSNPGFLDTFLGDPNYQSNAASEGTSPKSEPHAGNNIALPEIIFQPALTRRDAPPAPVLTVDLPAADPNVESGYTTDPNTAVVKIWQDPIDKEQTHTYLLYRREQKPDRPSPTSWRRIAVLTPPEDEPQPGEPYAKYTDEVVYNVLYWYRVVAVTDFGNSSPRDLSYAAPLRFYYDTETSQLGASFFNPPLVPDDPKAEVSDMDGNSLATSDNQMEREDFGLWATGYVENATKRPSRGIFVKKSIGRTDEKTSDWIAQGILARYFEMWNVYSYELTDETSIIGTLDIQSVHDLRAYHNAAQLPADQEDLGIQMAAYFLPSASAADQSTPSPISLELEAPIIPFTVIPRDPDPAISLIPKTKLSDQNRFGVLSENGSITDSGGNGIYVLVADPQIVFPFAGGTSALPTAFKKQGWAKIAPGDEISIGVILPIVAPTIEEEEAANPLGIGFSFKWNEGLFELSATVQNDDGSTTTSQLEPDQLLDPKTTDIRLKAKRGILAGQDTIKLTAKLRDVVVGSESVLVGIDFPVQSLQSTNDLRYTIPFNEASGARYRKIALSGRPLGDGKPQSKPETDQAPEETFIDALTLGLRHSTTDFYLPVPGADFAVSARRNATSEVWTTRFGLRPHERPDRPFGVGWTTNLAANLELVYPSNGDPIFAYVTDLDGVVHKFVAAYIGTDPAKPGQAPPLAKLAFVPVPSGAHEQSSYLEKLSFWINNENEPQWYYQARNGGWIQFENAGTDSLTNDTKLTRLIRTDRETGSDDTIAHSYYRVKETGDRLGNKLGYTYEGNPSLVPKVIQALNATGGVTGLVLSILQDEQGLITDIWDSVGHCQYTYAPHQYVSPLTNKQHTEWELKTVERPDGGTTRYAMSFVSDLDVFSPGNDPDSNPGAAKTTYFHADLASITNPRASITNPQEYQTSFTYEFDRTKFSYDSRAGYFIQVGRPRWVKSVSFPGGGSTFKNSPPNDSTWGIKLVATASGWSLSGANGVVRFSEVTDAVGATVTYRWKDPEVVLMNEVQQFMRDPRGTPRLICYKTMEIDYGTVGKETYTFDLQAGLALKSTTDLSGNTTSYVYDDLWTAPTIYRKVFSLAGFNGRFDDPTRQQNALHGKPDPRDPNRLVNGIKRFEYADVDPYPETYSRVMTKITDEAGRTTTYGLDGAGRRESETIKNANGIVEQVTRFSYENAKYPGVITRKVVEKQPGDTSPGKSLITKYVLDAKGRVQDEIVDPLEGTNQNGLNLVTSHTYDSNGNRLSTTNPRGYLTGFSYDACNRLKKVEYPGQFTKSFEYDFAGNKTSETDENGHVTTFTYDGLNRLETVTRSGLITRYSYNAVGSRTFVTDPKGNVTETQYDVLQRPEKIIDALKHETKFRYLQNSGGLAFDVSGFKPNEVEDARGIVTTYTFDGLYRQRTKTVPYEAGANATWETFYDDAGNPVQEKDPRGLSTWKDYDALNRPTKTTFEGGKYQQVFYNSVGQKYKVRDELEKETSTEYDGAGRPWKVTAPAVKDENDQMITPVTYTTYDRAGNVFEQIDPRSNKTTFYYDARNRKVKEVRPAVPDGLGGVLREPTLKFGYDKVGNLTASSDARGAVTVSSYDQWNRLVLLQHPAPGGREFTEYDNNGNVVKVTDANGHSITNTYDALNRLKTTVDAQNIEVSYGYDDVGNRTSVTDGMQRTTRFEYDGLNRNTVIKDPADKTVKFGYDGVNKVSRTDSLNRATIYTYDDRNRLETVHYPAPFSNGNLTYGYDDVGNLLSVKVDGAANVADVSYTYDALRRVETETSAGLTHTYRYDAVGNRRKVTYNGIQRTLISTYDALNRLEKLTDGSRETLYGYDLNGNVTAKKLPNTELVQMSYDALNRNRTIVGGGAAQLYSYTLGYDLAGNLTKSDEQYSSGLNNRVVTMKYDRANRLKEEKIASNGATTTTTYGYNAANSRTSKAVSVAGGGTTSTTYGYNTLNQLTSVSGSPGATFTYDDNGNRKTRTSGGQTDSYDYDADNRLISLSQEGHNYSYKYDYRTRRVERKEDGAATQVSFSGGTSVHEVEVSSGMEVEYVRGSDFGGGVGGILYSLRNGSPSFAHYNHRGDVTARTDSNKVATYQAAYEAFGTRTQEQGATADRQKANTKEEDPSGLLNEGFRYRDLETGTFITRDPAGFVDGPNLYAYVRQNPWTKFDPEGLFVSDFIDAGFILYDGFKLWTARTPAEKALYRANLAVDFAGLAVDAADFGTGGGTGVIVAGRAAIKAKQMYQAANAGLHATEIVLQNKANDSSSHSANNPSGKSGKSSPGGSARETKNAAEDAASREGGSHGSLQEIGDGKDSHHMPANDASPLSTDEGPAIKMDPADHQKTASWGRSKAAQQYREKQRQLIEQGKFNEAQQMDIDDIRSKFGDKYDEGIRQMQDYTRTIPPEKINKSK